MTWDYDSFKDEMRGETTPYAFLPADDSLTAKPPYRGGAAILSIDGNTLVPGQAPMRSEAGLITIKSDVQFTCDGLRDNNTGDDGVFDVKFDDGPVMEFRCSKSVTGDSQTFQIDDRNWSYLNSHDYQFDPASHQSFTQMLARSKRMTIELPVYEVGSEQIHFNVANLDLKRLNILALPPAEEKPTPPPKPAG